MWALRHSSGGRGLTGEKRNGSREDSHTRSVRWPAPLRASALKEHISLKEYTGDRVFLKMSYHPCVSGCGRSLAPQSLCSTSLPHRGYVGDPVGAAGTVSRSLANAPQSVSVAEGGNGDVTSDDRRIGISPERPIHFECN